MNKSDQKIFGVGFMKTGTTSLKQALEKLDYAVHGSFGTHDQDIANTALERCLRKVPDYDGFVDSPWPLFYRRFDRKYQGSKFILTTRPVDEWMNSCLRHFANSSSPMRKWIYGVGDPKGNEEIWIDRYQEHTAGVKEYFSDRQDDLLVLDITENNKWQKLCHFLGHDISDESFPHANSHWDRKIMRLKSTVFSLCKSMRIVD